MNFLGEFEEHLARFTSEFVGFFNVYTGSIGTVLSVFATLTMLINLLGSVSVTYFNPAVLLAVFAAGQDSLVNADGYVYPNSSGDSAQSLFTLSCSRKLSSPARGLLPLLRC